MDSDALVKITKSSVKEVVCAAFTVLVAPEVQRETVEEGKQGGHADASRIGENIQARRLKVRTPPATLRTRALVKELGLRGGEADTLRLFRGGGVDLVVSDDARFLRLLDGLGVPFATPTALMVGLVAAGKMTQREGLNSLDKLAGLVSEAEYLEARRALQELAG